MDPQGRCPRWTFAATFDPSSLGSDDPCWYASNHEISGQDPGGSCPKCTSRWRLIDTTRKPVPLVRLGKNGVDTTTVIGKGVFLPSAPTKLSGPYFTDRLTVLYHTRVIWKQETYCLDRISVSFKYGR